MMRYCPQKMAPIFGEHLATTIRPTCPQKRLNKLNVLITDDRIGR